MPGGGVERMLQRDEEGDQGDGPGPPALEEWLDYLERRRDVLIMELRGIDEILVRHGRLSGETIGRRSR